MGKMEKHSRLSRRSFLKVTGALAGGAILAGCRKRLPAPTAAATPVELPIPTGTAAAPAPLARVGITRANSYDPKLVRQQVESLLDSLGGLGDLVRPGAKVAIKTNLTGGVFTDPPPGGTTATESYLTHPAVVGAVAELLRDAGAKEIAIVESVWQWESYVKWGYVDLAKRLGANLIDLNSTKPYTDYATVPVGKDWFIYKEFTFNHLLEEVDCFVSVAKMKCHWLCGITQSMKNLVGLVPYKFYELTTGDGYRTGLHGAEEETKYRLPRVVLDLNRARPIHLSLIDGIQTVDGSEGPWNQDLRLKKPHLLIGGKNPVATDAVAAAAMGFDPTAEYPKAPFLRADNHLNIARQLGLGTNILSEIEVLGVKLEDVKMQFQPALETGLPRQGCFG
jgi:uncharacterized protein (DUF362 family)